MSTRKPSPGPLPDCVWWGTDVAPIPQAWEGPQPASDPPPAVPAHPADRWKRAARLHAGAPVSAAAPPRQLPVTRPPAGLCLQGGGASGGPGRRGRAPGSAGWARAGCWEAPVGVP